MLFKWGYEGFKGFSGLFIKSVKIFTTAPEINNPLWGVLRLARHHQRPSAPAALGPKKPTSGEFVFAPVLSPPPMRSLHGVVKSSKTEKTNWYIVFHDLESE